MKLNSKRKSGLSNGRWENVHSQFDLKQALILFQDGYSITGAVNNVSGYTTGVMTMAVDGITGAVANGDTFTLAGDTTVYTISAHTETTGNTTSITFAPGLVIAATDNEVFTVGPHSISVKIGEGNLQWTEHKPRVYVKDRGLLSSVRNGDEDPVDVRMDFIWEWIRGATTEPPTIEDVLKNRGKAANWITSASDTCEPFAVDILIKYMPKCVNTDWETITIPDYRYEELVHDAKNGTLNSTGKCNVTEVVSSRYAQPAA